MYEINDRVLYGIHGVCRIVGTESRTVDRRKQQFYVLEPVEKPGTRFYVPMDNQAAVAKMRGMLSAAGLQALLHSPEARRDAWIPEEGLRKLRYKELLASGDRAALLSMVLTLRRYRQERLAAGKKFHLSDDNFLHDAEMLLSSEISVVMDIPRSEVPAFVREQMQA